MRREKNPPGRDRENNWERKWSDEGFAPWWATPVVPKEFLRALADNHVGTTDPVLDVGCGNGLMTCALARDFTFVTGVDFSHSAIKIAKISATKTSRSPMFHARNVLSDDLPGAPFQAVLDRGCLHVIDEEHRKLYASNVHAHMNLTGVLLVMHKQDSVQQNLVEEIAAGLADHFSLSDALETHFDGNETAIPAVFFTFRPRER